MVDIEKILRKRKPTAKDTLDILINDVIAHQVKKLSRDKGTLPEDLDFIVDHTAIVQDDYSKVVLKLDEREFEKHQKNVKLYNLYFELIEDMERKHDQILAYLNCLTSSYDYDTIVMTQEIDTGTNLYTDQLQRYTAENIRAIKGYHCFVDALIRYTKNDLLEVTKVEVKTLNQAYKNYHTHISEDKDIYPGIYARYNGLRNEEYLSNIMLLSDNQKDTLTDMITDGLKGFETINSTDLLKANIYKNTFAFIRESESQEKIKQEHKQITDLDNIL